MTSVGAGAQAPTPTSEARHRRGQRTRVKANRDGHQLELVPGSWQIQRIFDITGMRRLFAWRGHY